MRNFRHLLTTLLLPLLFVGCGDDGNSSDNGNTPRPDASPSIDADTDLPDADTNTPDAISDDPDGGVPPVGDKSMLWFGDVNTNGTYELISYDGTTSTSLSWTGITTINDILDAAISPDGTQIAIALKHDGGDDVLYVANVDGSGTPTAIISAENETQRFNSIHWSPDGSRIAFKADIITNGMHLIYAAPSNGSEAPSLVSQNPNNEDQAAEVVGWFDNTHVLFRGDLETDNQFNFFISDIEAAPIAPLSLIPSAEFGKEAQGAQGRALVAGGKIYFLSEHSGESKFYRVDSDSTNFEQVPSAAVLTNASGNEQAQVLSFAISPDGTQLAFSADSPSADLFQVYVSSLDGNSPTMQSNLVTAAPASTSGPTGPNAMRWSPDGETIAIIANWQLGGKGSLSDKGVYVIPANGDAGGLRLWQQDQALTVNPQSGFAFSSDSSLLYLFGDWRFDNDAEVYASADFATSDQSLTDSVLEEVPLGGDAYGFAVQK